MFFSILVAVYNAEDYLEKCIMSIIEQTYKDFELILIDDGSKDKSGYICEKFKNKYPELIKVYHQENKGLLFSRRRGFRLASGEYYIMCDADDYLAVDALEKIYYRIEKTKADMLIYNAFLDKEGKIEPFYQNIFLDNQTFEGEQKKIIYQEVCKGYALNSLCLKAVHKSIIDISNDYSKYGRLMYGEDLLQSLALFTNAKKIVYLNESLYYYRMQANSSTHQFDEKKFDSYKLVISLMEKYIDEWGIPESKDFLGIQLFNYLYNSYIFLSDKTCTLSLQKKYKFIEKLSKDESFRKWFSNLTFSFMLCNMKKKKIFICYLFYYKLYSLLILISVLHQKK